MAFCKGGAPQISFLVRADRIVPADHLCAAGDSLPRELEPCRQDCPAQRDCREGKPLTIECVVRGYLAGSGWKEYQKSQPSAASNSQGLKESSNCQNRFSPATKAETGHDEEHSFAEACKLVGADIAGRTHASLKIYNFAATMPGSAASSSRIRNSVQILKTILIDEVPPDPALLARRPIAPR
jgi:phosphoribosylaminoimidazole-succinocarboxamide synthase